jgi:small ligand-binding sensory domain FIST
LAAFAVAWEQAAATLGGQPHLVAVFASAHHAHVADGLAEDIARRAPDATVLGCCAADGVIGGERELQGEPAVAVWLARFGGEAMLTPFHLVVREGADGELFVLGWPESETSPELVVAIADPYTFPVEALVDQIDDVPVVGGLAGLGSPGSARLLWTGGLVREGAVGVALRGVPLQPLVSQGARPIGPELVVTAADGSAILELAGRPALDKLREVLEDLPPAETALARDGLMVGRVIDENRAEHGVGDFLVRGLVGVDESRSALLVADHPRVGQLVRLHVRDARSADAELSLVLDRAEQPAAGALLFSCNGRGRRLFAVPDHDASAVSRSLAGAPVAGMFCQGEIGPVGGRTFLHGFTATMVVFGENR